MFQIYSLPDPTFYEISEVRFRTCLHQASASTLRQLCDDVSDFVLIENNRVPPHWGCNPIPEWFYCFQWEQNRKRHRSVDADAWYKWASFTLNISINVVGKNGNWTLSVITMVTSPIQRIAADAWCERVLKAHSHVTANVCVLVCVCVKL